MTARQAEQPVEQLLTVGAVAELLGTTDRFPRRLIAERRIRFARVGRHVRIPVSAVREFIGEWIDPDLGKVHFEAYAAGWIRDRMLKPRTEELYRSLLAIHLLPFSATGQ